MHYLNTTCPPNHHHNSFMATGALGHIHVHFTFYWHSRQLKSVQVTNKVTSIMWNNNVGSRNTQSAQIPPNYNNHNILALS